MGLFDGYGLGIGLSGKLDNAYALLLRKQQMQAARAEQEQRKQNKAYETIQKNIKVNTGYYHPIIEPTARNAAATFLSDAISKQKADKTYLNSYDYGNANLVTQTALKGLQRESKEIDNDEILVQKGVMAWKPDYQNALESNDYEMFNLLNNNQPYSSGKGTYKITDEAQVLKELQASNLNNRKTNIEKDQKLTAKFGLPAGYQYYIFDKPKWDESVNRYFDQHKNDLVWQYGDGDEAKARKNFNNIFGDNVFETTGMFKGKADTGNNNYTGRGAGTWNNAIYTAGKDPQTGIVTIETIAGSEAPKQTWVIKDDSGKESTITSGFPKINENTGKAIFYVPPKKAMMKTYDPQLGEVFVELDNILEPEKVIEVPIEQVASQIAVKTTDKTGKSYVVKGYSSNVSPETMKRESQKPTEKKQKGTNRLTEKEQKEQYPY